MINNNIDGLILLFVGLYMSIRFRYNGERVLRGRMRIAKRIPIVKIFNRETTKSDILGAQLMSLIVGILFIIIGLSKIFNF